MAAVVVSVAVVLATVVAQVLRPALEAGLRQPLRLAAELALAGVVVWSSARDAALWALLRLRDRQSFSAGMARSSASPEKPTYERVPRSR